MDTAKTVALIAWAIWLVSTVIVWFAAIDEPWRDFADLCSFILMAWAFELAVKAAKEPR